MRGSLIKQTESVGIGDWRQAEQLVHIRGSEMWCREVGRAEAGHEMREETLMGDMVCRGVREPSVSY